MGSRALMATGLALLVCCCCCANRDQEEDPPPPSSSQAVSAYANDAATVAARGAATAYTQGLLTALQSELPSLVLLDTGTQDRCAPGQCYLAADFLFGLDGDLTASLRRVDAVLRRDSTQVATGIDSLRGGGPACAELLYELKQPQGTRNAHVDPRERARPWTSTVLAFAPADVACAARLESAPATPAGPLPSARGARADLGSLPAGAAGRHRFVMRVGVEGWYLAGP